MAKFTYRFCPQCRTHLTQQTIDAKTRSACPSCDFIYVENPKVAVIGFIVCQGRVLLIQRAVDPEKGKWAIPGGYMDAGEVPEEALQREMLEEVGLEITIDRLMGSYPLFQTKENGTQQNLGLMLVYQVSPKSGQLEELSAYDDVAQAAWFLPNETPTDLAFDLTEKLLDQWQASPN